MNLESANRAGNLEALVTPPRFVSGQVVCGLLLCGSYWFAVVVGWAFLLGALPFFIGCAYFPLGPERVPAEGETLHQIPGVLILGSLGSFVCAALGVRKGLKVIRLLRNGDLAWATVTHRQFVRVSDDADVMLTLAFRLPGGTTVELVQYEGRLAREETIRITDYQVGVKVPVLYDPQSPKDCCLLWHQHPVITWSPSGQWASESYWGRALLVSVSLIVSAVYLCAGLFWLMM